MKIRIMVVGIYIVRMAMNIIYAFMKIAPSKNDILLISRQSNEASTDIKLLSEKIKEMMNGYEVEIFCKTIPNDKLGKLKYACYVLSLMNRIAKARVVVLDSYCIPICLLNHKKNLVIIQMWHAMGLFKKAGISILDNEEGRDSSIAKALRMHQNYDYFFASTKECVSGLSKVFGMEEEKAYIGLLPLADLLQDTEYVEEKTREIKEKYQLTSEKIIVYAPTFRKDEALMQAKVDEWINMIDLETYSLFIKLHPLSKIEIHNDKVIVDKSYQTYEIMMAADYVVSDYSSVVFEACILKKKLLFYAFDYDHYNVSREFFIDYAGEVPGKIVGNAQELISEIEAEQYDFEKQNEFSAKYLNIQKENTQKIVHFIMEQVMSDNKHEE